MIAVCPKISSYLEAKFLKRGPLIFQDWYIPLTQARDSQTLPRVVTRAQPEGQPEVKSDCPELGLEV